MSVAAANAATTAGAGLPVTYALGGSASVASTDPSEMYFVTQTVTAKMARAGTMAARRQDREDAAGGGDALAAAEAEPHRVDVADDRRQTGGRRRRRLIADVLGQASRSARLS